MRSSGNVLVAVANPKTATGIIAIAAALAEPGEEVIALSVIEVPGEQSFLEGAALAWEQRRRLHQVTESAQAAEVEVHPCVRIARQVGEGIRREVAEKSVRLLVVGWSASINRADHPLAELLMRPPCDLAVVRAHRRALPRRILVPVRGGAHAELALELASKVARRSGGGVTALRVDLAGDAYRRAADIRSFDEALAHSSATVPLRQTTESAASVAEAIGRELAEHDAVVLGATAATCVLPDAILGPIATELVGHRSSTIMVVKTREPVSEATFVPPQDPVRVIVDKWFAENTFHHREFADLAQLVDLKRRRNVSISVCLPTLNERDTIVRILQTFRDELVDRFPLIDDLLVVDSGSTDGTLELARQFGVSAYDQRQILPHLGHYPGKGEALWKSLHVARGDLVVWVESDLKNVHPRFVYGLVGPLLREPRLVLVNGFYRRPLRIGDAVPVTSGERLTEFAARPIVNLCFPELSGVVELLAGNTAGRRAALERLPFSTGPVVELGLLIDAQAEFGLAAIGQCDLEERIHRVPPLVEQSRQATSLVHLALRRLERRVGARLLDREQSSLKFIHHQPDRFFLEVQELGEVERPPMMKVVD